MQFDDIYYPMYFSNFKSMTVGQEFELNCVVVEDGELGIATKKSQKRSI